MVSLPEKRFWHLHEEVSLDRLAHARPLQHSRQAEPGQLKHKLFSGHFVRYDMGNF